MKILFVDTYYSGFLKSFRKNNPKLFDKPYAIQKRLLLDQCFGTSDFFSFNFKKIGWDASDIIINDEILQRKWANENKVKVAGDRLISKIQMLPYAYRIFGKPKWVQQIALAQIKKYNPDIVYMQDLSILNPTSLKEVKKYCKLLVGQIASPLPPQENLKIFDLIITSFPHYVKLFKKMGIKSKYNKLAFEPRVLNKIGKMKKIYNIAFIGSFTPYHKEGTKILEQIAKQIPINIWGQGIEFLSPLSPLRKNYHGEAWGREMYNILAQSKIVINRHIKVAENYANNMRLFEATGMGAMLITEKKKNLNELFVVRKEIEDYKDSEELIKKVRYYLKNDRERELIARFGQQRTLNDHNYLLRITQLSKLLHKYL